MGVNHDVGSSVASESRQRPRLRRGAKAFVSCADSVLLLRENHRDGSAFWTLPGGGVRTEESPQRALRREIREELQCEAVVGPSRCQYTYAHRSRPEVLSLYTVYDCAIVGRPTPNPEEGAYQCRWVQPPACPARTLPQVRALIREEASPDAE